jgi:hypothetical protein
MKKTIFALSIICATIISNSAKADTAYHSLKNTALAKGWITKKDLTENLEGYEKFAKGFIEEAGRFTGPLNKKQRAEIKRNLNVKLADANQMILEQINSTPELEYVPNSLIMTVTGMGPRLNEIAELVNNEQIWAARAEIQTELANIQELLKD